MDGENNSVRAPRLCTMARSPAGYGFNLHGEKGVSGQYISAVDKPGPADVAGLCVGDRVVEVNDTNVEEASHAQVVAKIKENPQRAVLLVVDKVTDEYLAKIGVAITSDLAKHDTVLVLEQEDAGVELNDIDTAEDNTAEDNTAEDNTVNDEADSPSKDHASSEVAFDSPEREASPETTTPEDNAAVTEIEQVVADMELEERDNTSETHSTSEPDETRRGSDLNRNGYANSMHDERVSQSSEDSSMIDSGRTSADSARLSMAAALPKPRRRQIKEDKSESWASKAALFNNL